jgi:hypothetical protein
MLDLPDGEAGAWHSVRLAARTLPLDKQAIRLHVSSNLRTKGHQQIPAFAADDMGRWLSRSGPRLRQDLADLVRPGSDRLQRQERREERPGPGRLIQAKVEDA